MTAPTLTRTRFRRRPAGPTLAQVQFAARVVDELAAHRPVHVSVDGEGGGWCITAVDAQALTFTLWRDRQSLVVAWSAVRDQ